MGATPAETAREMFRDLADDCRRVGTNAANSLILDLSFRSIEEGDYRDLKSSIGAGLVDMAHEEFSGAGLPSTVAEALGLAAEESFHDQLTKLEAAGIGRGGAA